VTDEHYRTALDAARRELEELTEKREQLDTRIAQLRQIIATLAPLCFEYPDLDLGVTAACRTALRSSVEAIPAPLIRDRVAAMGVDLTRYANPLAVVHTVLKRLIANGEVRSTTGFGNKTVFWMHRPVTTVVLHDPGKHATASPMVPPAVRRKKARPHE
jgi:hypothetical protein